MTSRGRRRIETFPNAASRARGIVLALVAGIGWTWGGTALAEKPAPVPAGKPVNFAKEIRPILSDNCFACHGPDDKQRKAGLRLDTREGAFAKLKSGETALVAGKPDDSSLLFRIESDDDGLKMPPPKSGKTLTPQQIALVRRWIEQGATWSSHWAFEVPKNPELPKVNDKAWPRTEVDRFILARLEAEGLKPAPEANKTSLIRALTLDLTGLPPTPAEIDAFLADSSDKAYEKVVDRLLDSPRYGEHMARYWLDAARYGDTHGLHLDNYREIWPYRDWVIKAFNANKPFDAFIVEQLAGDLLPNPSIDQIVATGFNRCHVSTSEGGSIEEEVYVRNVVDQVDTNGTVFLGLTTGCARCHDHKYDPIRQKDYYQLFAFFNNNDGPALDGNSARWAPITQVPTAEQSAALKAADAKVASLKQSISAESAKALATYDPKVDENQSEVVERSDFVWIDDAIPLGAAAEEGKPWDFVSRPEHPVHSGRHSVRISGKDLNQRVFTKAARKLRAGPDDRLFAYIYIDPLDPPKEIMLQWFANGKWDHRAYWGENLIDWGRNDTNERRRVGDIPPSGKWVRIEVSALQYGLRKAPIEGWAFTQHGGTVYWDTAGIETWTPQDGQTYDSLTAWIRSKRADKGAGLSPQLQAIVNKARAQRTEAERKELLTSFAETGWSKAQGPIGTLRAELATAEAARKAIDDGIPTTLVSRERTGEPKEAFLLNRGEYDQKRDKVGRSTPAFLPPLPPGEPVNRLGFAKWLIAPNHPLTARVVANRFWLQVFGTGIVKTAEDFGSQGEPPSHPELLDWLAVNFREEGWDTKRFMKRLVMSSTYRQSTKITPEKLAKDPSNRLLSRGARFRLDAETLRDQALFLAGLLVEKVGGPSVKPPQPAGLWEAVAYTGSNTAKFSADSGLEKVHRRALYTFLKRTAPPPQMSTFDAPSRESCTVRRERTNTPLQALMLMNEPQFVEAARSLAGRTIREGGSNTEDRLAYMFRLATSRRPDDHELGELAATFNDLRAHYAKNAEAAKQLIAIGESKPDPKLDPVDLAGWTMIGNVILNLDEVVSK